MTRLLKIISALLLMGVGASVFAAPESAPQGISFYTLRVIYSAHDKQGVSLAAHNNSPAPYLVQSWLRPVDNATGDVDLHWQGEPGMPFVVTPPLSRIEANSELALRIRRNDVPLPQDRESVFFISMKAMPVQPQKSEQGKMVMTVVSNLKLFYRPDGLKRRAVEEMAPKLKFHREGHDLVATNPTPYWLTFSHLASGASELGKAGLRLMVPPFGQRSYPIDTSSGASVTWRLIDEDGWDTPDFNQPL
ncbi:MAG: molecular chaperone [Enterobacter sp.]|jgi:P pilus assembly chaperone PapD|nr:molecular chaperone [Enterobacter sp.]